jgi:hypothetical protein
MKKLSLDLDRLTVDTFQPESDDDRASGTVGGQAPSVELGYICDPSVDPATGCEATTVERCYKTEKTCGELCLESRVELCNVFTEYASCGFACTHFECPK